MRLRSIFGLSPKQWLRLAREEIGLLAVILGMAGGLLTFVWLAEEISEGETHTFDQRILLACRNPQNLADPIGPRWFEEVARDMTALGGVGVLVLVSLSLIGFLLLLSHRRSALLVLIAVGGGLAVSSTLKTWFARPRPDLVPHGSYVVTASFPSGHAMLSAVAYLTIATIITRRLSKRREKAYVMALATLLTVLIGLSRVYLGVHWPTDVLAGWCIGATWAMACWTVDVWLARRGVVSAEFPDGPGRPS
jgi:undecaprenyl-diphosphatase